jgi:hypothetical protein
VVANADADFHDARRLVLSGRYSSTQRRSTHGGEEKNSRFTG